MKRLVIVGATGMVGGYALCYALEHPDVEHVTSVGRKKLGISHSKLTEVLHPDFTDCSALAQTLAGQDGAVFCLGTYTGAVKDAELRRITVDYTAEFASAYSGDGDRRFRFIVTGLARSEVLGVDDNSVGHVGCFVGTGFGLFGDSAQRLTLKHYAMRVM